MYPQSRRMNLEYLNNDVLAVLLLEDLLIDASRVCDEIMELEIVRIVTSRSLW